MVTNKVGRCAHDSRPNMVGILKGDQRRPRKGVRRTMNKYEEALKIACKYLGDNDCPYTHGLDFEGCLKEECRDELELCWEKYFLEKMEENNKMNKYLLEVEAIQFTGDNAKEIEEKLSEGLDLAKEDLNIEIERYENEDWLSFSDILNFYDIAKGSYIVVAPKRGTTGGYLFAIMTEKEFEEYARRLY